MLPKLWLVGGTVRDFLFGVLKHSNDVDFAVEADSFADMKAWLNAEHGLTVWQERPEFVTLRGRAKFARGTFGGLLGDKVERDADFTLCRAETQYSDRRHPDTVTPAPLAVDLGRRDFTVNAVAVGEDGVWADPFNGRRDADYGMLRCVGDAGARFREDPLRMLRALRFVVKHRLTLDRFAETALDSTAYVDLVRSLPHERVREELGKSFQHDWLATCHALSTDFSRLAYAVEAHFPNLWLKATTEDK